MMGNIFSKIHCHVLINFAVITAFCIICHRCPGRSPSFKPLRRNFGISPVLDMISGFALVFVTLHLILISSVSLLYLLILSQYCYINTITYLSYDFIYRASSVLYAYQLRNSYLLEMRNRNKADSPNSPVLSQAVFVIRYQITLH